MSDYKTLVDFPGVPAGEIMVLNENGLSYHGQTHTDFWLVKTLVENQPENEPPKFEIQS